MNKNLEPPLKIEASVPALQIKINLMRNEQHKTGWEFLKCQPSDSFPRSIGNLFGWGKNSNVSKRIFANKFGCCSHAEDVQTWLKWMTSVACNQFRCSFYFFSGITMHPRSLLFLSCPTQRDAAARMHTVVNYLGYSTATSLGLFLWFTRTHFLQDHIHWLQLVTVCKQSHAKQKIHFKTQTCSQKVSMLWLAETKVPIAKHNNNGNICTTLSQILEWPTSFNMPDVANSCFRVSQATSNICTLLELVTAQFHEVEFFSYFSPGYPSELHETNTCTRIPPAYDVFLFSQAVDIPHSDVPEFLIRIHAPDKKTPKKCTENRKSSRKEQAQEDGKRQHETHLSLKKNFKQRTKYKMCPYTGSSLILRG